VAELETWLREQRARIFQEQAKPSTTASSAGARSPASSMTGVSAYPTMLQSARSAPSPWGALRRSDEGSRRAAAIYTLIQTAKLNDVDPQAWLADVLARLPDHPARRIEELLPWQWCGSRRLAA
jgi:transposase